MEGKGSEPRIFEFETLSDVVKLLKTKDARDNGVAEAVFHREGIASIHVAATALRARGYEIEIFEGRRGRSMRLLASPAVGAKKRKAAQTSLFDAPPKTRGPYEEAA